MSVPCFESMIMHDPSSDQGTWCEPRSSLWKLEIHKAFCSFKHHEDHNILIWLVLTHPKNIKAEKMQQTKPATNRWSFNDFGASTNRFDPHYPWASRRASCNVIMSSAAKALLLLVVRTWKILLETNLANHWESPHLSGKPWETMP